MRQLKKVDLPAPFGPIRPRISPWFDRTEAVDGLEGAERLRDAFGLKQHASPRSGFLRARNRRCTRSSNPPGRNRAISMMMAP